MADNQLVRPPGKIISLTDEQIAEVIKCADPNTGYEHFLTHYFYIQHPIKGQLLFDPFPYQMEMLHNMHENKYCINLTARQLGKCLNKDTKINIRNNITGKKYEMPIGIFYEYNRARRAGEEGPDISSFEVIE